MCQNAWKSEVRPAADDPHGTIDVHVTARDATYEPLDNATATVHVQDPDGATMTLTAQPSETEARDLPGPLCPGQTRILSRRRDR